MPRSRPFAVAPLARALLAVTAALPFLGCVTHTHCSDLSGVPGLRGEPVEYQTTTSYALHGLFLFPLLGDGTLESTMGEFTKEASGHGGKRVDIAETSKLTLWFILPPISFFVHPVITEVGGSIEIAAPAR